MTWEQRLKQVTYTSPSGAVFEWAWEVVSRSVDKKGGEFTFPDAVGTFIQDLGPTGRRYPFRCFFNGDDNDTESDAFFEALTETGVGVLDHPRYGRLNVVPFGAITQREDLKREANQSVVEVTFFDTIDIIFPTGLVSPSSDVLSAVVDFNSGVSVQFAEVLGLDSQIEKVSFRDNMSAATARIKDFLEPVYSQTDDIRRESEAIIASINNSVTTLVGEPLAYAAQTLQLIQLPARAGNSIKARLDGYKNLANQILSIPIFQSGNDSQPDNTFRVDELSVTGNFTGYGLSAINGEFQNKTQAIEAADDLLTLLDDVTTWRDDNIRSLEIVDTQEIYGEMLNVVGATAAYLVAISFDLPQQKTIVLDRPRTIIDLAAEIFPNLNAVDDVLDDLINDNELVGEDIFLLPAGKSITYFV